MQSAYHTRKLKAIMAFPDFGDKPTKRETVTLKTKRANRVRSITKAKTLTGEQFAKVIAEIMKGPDALRNSAIWHLSFYAGLRVQEIAGLQWKRNVLDNEGDIAVTLHVTKDIGKRTKERFIPMAPELKIVLKRLRDERPTDRAVIYPLYERDDDVVDGSSTPKDQVHPNTLAQFMRRLYKTVGYDGCTSHSGRRTLITGMARRCNLVDASIRDVQEIAGHSDINITMGYVEESPHRSKLVQRGFA